MVPELVFLLVVAAVQSGTVADARLNLSRQFECTHAALRQFWPLGPFIKSSQLTSQVTLDTWALGHDSLLVSGQIKATNEATRTCTMIPFIIPGIAVYAVLIHHGAHVHLINAQFPNDPHGLLPCAAPIERNPETSQALEA
jgi:hypothetical protein